MAPRRSPSAGAARHQPHGRASDPSEAAGTISRGDVRLQMQQVRELVLVKASLGRLNVVVVSASDVRTEAQRWQVILPSRNVNSYTG